MTSPDDFDSEVRRALESLPSDLSWLVPPEDLHSSEAWDRWWRDQITAKVPLMFVDMFCHDDQLLDAIRARGLSTVLCVGSGVSLEPHALAAAGLQVTVLDISAVATEWASHVSNTPKGLQRFFKPEHVRPGGSLQFCVGDLTDASICPGPYDVIVERKTLQLFPDGERSGAVSAVVARLSENGLLLTHSHDGRWKPPASRRDPVRPILERSGLHVTGVGAPLPAEGRVAFSFVSTG